MWYYPAVMNTYPLVESQNLQAQQFTPACSGYDDKALMAWQEYADGNEVIRAQIFRTDVSKRTPIGEELVVSGPGLRHGPVCGWAGDENDQIRAIVAWISQPSEPTDTADQDAASQSSPSSRPLFPPSVIEYAVLTDTGWSTPETLIQADAVLSLAGCGEKSRTGHDDGTAIFHTTWLEDVDGSFRIRL